MRSRYCALSLLVLLMGLNPALAQQPKPADKPPDESQSTATDAQQKKAQETPSGRLGTNEPTTQAPGARQADSNAVFVNGALTVPGAPDKSDTVPAKFSAKNDADDKLITLAYTFKNLTDEQRRTIYEALKDRPAGNAWKADVGVALPASVESVPVPETVTAQVPQTRGYDYIAADGRILLVAPANRFVVGVIAPEQPTTQGAR